MAGVAGLDFVSLQVRDLGVSESFYTERLGLEVYPQGSSQAVVFRAGSVLFEVREPLVDLDAVEKLGWGVGLWMKCDDAQGLHDSLKTHKTPIAQEPFDGPFGRAFTFVDPDGYLVTVHDG